MKELIISLGDEQMVSAILGQRDHNLNLIEKALLANIMVRGNEVHLSGSEEERKRARNVFEHLKTLAKAKVEINDNVINYAIANADKSGSSVAESLTGNIYTTPRGKQIKPRTLGQKKYVDALEKNDIVFSIGPAGTG
ncbi:MAG: PhoH family protein, partial [Clostridiales bacterium]